jgi:hypothetical protein
VLDDRCSGLAFAVLVLVVPIGLPTPDSMLVRLDINSVYAGEVPAL